MLKVIISAFFVIISFLLQGTLFRAISLGNIVPNLMIIVTASYGFMRGRKNGLLIGFFSGLLMDVFLGSILGYYALIYMYIGYFNGIFRKAFFPEDIKLPLLLISGSDFIYNMVCYILSFLLKGRLNFGYYFLNIMIPELIYTIVITCLFYPILLKIEGRLEWKEKEGASKIVS